MSSITTEYALKRCKQLGYFKTAANVKNIVDKESLINVLYLTDDLESSDFAEVEAKVSNNIDDIKDLDPSVHHTIIIKLANEAEATVHNPVELPELNNIIIDQVINHYSKLVNSQVADRLFKKFSKYITNYSYFDDKELDDEVLDCIEYLYDHINDTMFQENMGYILRSNNKTVSKPPAFVEETIKVYPHTELFEDIKIATDNKAKHANNKKFSRKATDLNDESNINNLVQLQAFTSNMFVVMHGKKNCAIPNASHLQNHDIINTLWRNGVHTTPISTYDKPKFSFDKLVHNLHKLDSFTIYFIHPNLEIPGSVADTPCDDVQPSYSIGFGEILAISYRYITLNFFPYCSVHADDMEQLGFII